MINFLLAFGEYILPLFQIDTGKYIVKGKTSENKNKHKQTVNKTAITYITTLRWFSNLIQ